MQSGARYGPNLLCNAVQRRSTLRNWGQHAKEQALNHRTVIQQVTNALERQLQALSRKGNPRAEGLLERLSRTSVACGRCGRRRQQRG